MHHCKFLHIRPSRIIVQEKQTIPKPLVTTNSVQNKSDVNVITSSVNTNKITQDKRNTSSSSRPAWPKSNTSKLINYSRIDPTSDRDMKFLKESKPYQRQVTVAVKITKIDEQQSTTNPIRVLVVDDSSLIPASPVKITAIADEKNVKESSETHSFQEDIMENRYKKFDEDNFDSGSDSDQDH